ncbi:glycerate dehydrogenase [Rhizodiscina lignyota]|uniref:Glycerate dehydrogenase n=1 Tax=Rhizodiscina lignyota TaxID=1504668 RepID=A0A9P4M479_9PEZI|nr:glycerate dehydrogenase [Rhizodiscina lignyota]
MPSSGPVQVAILDDYLDVARKHFAQIDPSKASITVFKDSLPPFTHAATSKEDKAALINRLKPFTVIASLRERTAFPRELLEALPNLKVLLATGTQFQTFDLGAMKELGITVATSTGKGRTDRPRIPAPKGGTHHTVQHSWAMILGLASNIARDDLVVKTGGWETELAVGLTGKTLGLVGLGRLGAATARIGVLAWGMKIIAWSENLNQEKADDMAKQMGLPVEDESGEKTFKSVSKEELFKGSDIVSIHYVLSARSIGIIGEKELSAMKKSAFFVNTSRGPLVDEIALLKTVRNGSIRGAALDVFDIEPLPTNSPWRSQDWGQNGSSHVLLTPHMGYVEERTINNWYAEQAENLERYLDGKELLNLL